MAAFDRSFDADEKYDLLYEDGSTALFLPGTKEFFELEKCRFELGRDYKRITFYLCTQSDIDLNEEIVESSFDEVKEFTGDIVSLDDLNTSQNGQDTCTSQDEQIARQLQKE